MIREFVQGLAEVLAVAAVKANGPTRTPWFPAGPKHRLRLGCQRQAQPQRPRLVIQDKPALLAKLRQGMEMMGN
jgi:hypothetical protein